MEPKGKNMTELTDDWSQDPPPEVAQTKPAARAAARFLYPGGSKPLDGYTIKRGIGHGGFGEIYYAVSDAGKEVALKLIRRNLDVELRGIRHCLNLKHPNLLDLYDIKQDENGDTWVIMAYVGGQSLEDAIDANPTGMPVDQVVAWMHGIGQGVAYLHDRGIVHRDLKPGNIFSDEGVVKVGDYGLSKFLSCSHRSGQTESVGTVHYMAPEVANGRYGKEIDIYALGVVLYEMLTGRVPFDGESTGEVLMKHLTAKPDVSMLAEPFRSVVALALEKDPANRFESVAAMLNALPQPSQAIPGSGRIPPAAAAQAPNGHSGQSPFSEEPIRAEAVDEDEEPLAKAFRTNWEQAREAWDRADLHPVIKLIMLLALIFVVLSTSPAVIVMGFVLIVAYGGYRVIRAWVINDSSSRPPTARPAPVAAAPLQSPPKPAAAPPRSGHQMHAPVERRRPRPLRRERATAALLVKSRRQRTTELFGSLLGSGVVCLATCVVMMMLDSLRGNQHQPEQFAWLLLVSMAGSWAVLIPSKYWEGTDGEQVLRRFAMMVVGMTLGIVAFAAADWLMVSLPHGHGFIDSADFQLPAEFYDGGRPLTLAFMAVFGSMFLLTRWWRQADPRRRSRFSLWSLFVTVLVAVIVAAIWQFPQAWLAMAAGAISVSVQLASPWVPRREFDED